MSNTLNTIIVGHISVWFSIHRPRTLPSINRKELLAPGQVGWGLQHPAPEGIILKIPDYPQGPCQSKPFRDSGIMSFVAVG